MMFTVGSLSLNIISYVSSYGPIIDLNKTKLFQFNRPIEVIKTIDSQSVNFINSVSQILINRRILEDQFSIISNNEIFNNEDDNKINCHWSIFLHLLFKTLNNKITKLVDTPNEIKILKDKLFKHFNIKTFDLNNQLPKNRKSFYRLL